MAEILSSGPATVSAWIPVPTLAYFSFSYVYRCSQCGNEIFISELVRFFQGLPKDCPCGAKMRE
jgi:hypothetical protein